MRAGRGQITDAIKEKSLEVLGYEISQLELRLMPYVQYQLMNEKKLEPGALNLEEKAILSRWHERGFIVDGVTPNGRPLSDGGLQVTKVFWDAMNEILWIGYADIETNEED